ncbi:MAG TPA: TonB-dependent receptor [Burkholderiaceae bacterium]|nr:TonB-dependent receptor [Burkholderiaceae bacterium]
MDAAKRTKAILAALLCGVFGGRHIGEVQAAEAAAQPESLLEEVVVTATKRQEAVQNISMAVSAYTSAFRDRIHLEGVQDVANFTPGMTALDDPDDRIIIRGIGRMTNAPGSDPGVGVYVDGVYTTSTADVASNTLAIDRIEVLRGPQGTLYGRNTVGGAVNVISKRPTRDFSGELRAGFGNYNHGTLGLSLSGPLNDALRVRLDASKEDHSGYIRNLGPGNDLATEHKRQVTGQLELDITKKLQFWLRAAYSEYDQAPDFRVLREQWRNDVFFEGLVIHPWWGYTEVNPAIANPWEIRQNEHQTHRNRSPTGQIHLDYNGDRFTTRYIGALSRWNWSMHYDGDGIAQTHPVDTVDLWGNSWTVPVAGTVDWTKRKHFQSHELQFLSNSNSALSWVGGLYYYHEVEYESWDWRTPGNAWLENAYLDGTQTNWWETGTSEPNPEARGWYQGGTVDAESRAAYAQARYDLAKRWKLIGGLRYSVDKKTGDEFQQWWWMPQSWWLGPNGPLYSLLDPATNQYVAASITGGLDRAHHSARWPSTTGLLSLEFRPREHTLWYLSLSQGTKSGGFLMGALADQPGTARDEGEVQPEKLTAYELGLKADLTDHFRLNAALYHYDYRDMQTEVTVVRGSQSFTELKNANKARADGLELEALWRMRPSTALTLTAAFSNSKLVDFCGSDAQANPDGSSGCLVNWQKPGIAYDPSGHVIPQSPKVQVAANFSQDFRVGANLFNVNLTHTYVGPQEFSVLFLEGSRGSGYHRTDLNASFGRPDGHLQVFFYAKNLSNSLRPTVVGQDGPQYGPIKWAYYSYPRIYGAELRFHW